MSALIEQPIEKSERSDQPPIVNDFTINVATVNGSGSQTANATIIRALFKMGIPVTGKNIFPSNISGLPTWYTIRVNKDGYTARRDSTEILVAFNSQTADADLESLKEGAVCIHPQDVVLKDKANRPDVIFYTLPVKQFVKEANVDVKLRDYIANMAYVGVIMELLGIEPEQVKAALQTHFKGKAKPVEINYNMVNKAAEYVRNNLPKQDPYKVERMNATTGKFMIDGNSAGALGAIFGGVSFVSWYPITPSTSLVDALNDYLPELRPEDENGKATYAVVQAEDELAAAGMVIGAGWVGARSMTATSGPGISLMTEFTGLGYFAEIPGVIWDIMRMGPSTGLPTRVSQGDVLKTYYLGHGDTKNICLLPSNMKECFEFGWRAFDLAERLQTPVFVLSDLDLGMNLWMTDPFDYPAEPMDRGKVLTAAQLKELQGKWGRYEDVDGDGIAYRTLPGNQHPAAAYFARGTGHNPQAGYSERPDDWENNLARLAQKHDTARTLVPKPAVDERAGAKVGIISYGSADPAVVEARDQLREAGIETSYLRLKALPLDETTREFIGKYDHVYVVEINFDAQMRSLLQLHTPEYATRLIAANKCDGLPLTAQFIADKVKQGEGKA
ncbi:MAG: 2-oxoacid:acceptor oxidoreductase subunit alpha [Chloroflexi bacterium]|nr:2-oxoacid:acceptor oxidoreductase subunit alpha [Chloroflexota bacterium]OJW04280.1 MAG: ferredoxin oxidoreductase [Chloroflexi bacterium 54-19]